jgi:methionyl-tRNA formyltransferase
LSPTPVKEFALARGIPVSHAAEDVISTRAELGVVVAFGKLIRPPVLEAVPMVNVHFSLLPRWRGAAPIERAILEGDTETGVCLMALDEGLDTGPIYANPLRSARARQPASFADA